MRSHPNSLVRPPILASPEVLPGEAGDGPTLVAMSTVELPPQVAARFEAEAARRGVSVADLLATLAEDLPATERTAPGRPGFVALGASTSGRTAREADELLADGFGR